MVVARFWGVIAAALMAVLALAPVSARAEVRLAPCNGVSNGSTFANPYGGQAIKFECEANQQRHGPGDFAVDFKFDPVVAPADDPLVFRMASVWQDSSKLRFGYADGSTATVIYRSADASRFLRIGALFEIPVPRHNAALTGIELVSTGTANLRGVVQGAALMPRSASQTLNERLIALYAAFAGLSLALIAYNLSLWAALRHKFQLIYCATVTAISAYVFTSSGAAMLVFPAMANQERLRLNYLFLTLACVIALSFIRHFFGKGVFPRWLWRAGLVLSTIALACSIAFALFAPLGIGLLDRIYFIAMGLLVLLVLPMMIHARRSPHFVLFALAWSAPIGASALRSLHGFGLVPYSFWLDNGNLIALVIEALLSSFMITARLREIGRERDDALEGEVSAMRLANSDPLTGLMNRRAFMQEMLGREGRQRLMLIDIDRFKDINDRIGHEGGDEVLRRVARAIQSVRPAESLAVRLGGEEFGLLVPEDRAFLCPPDLVLEAVRCRAMPMEQKVTVSLGYGEGIVSSEAEWTRLYRLADAALYRAKADGRDRASRSTDFTRTRRKARA